MMIRQKPKSKRWVIIVRGPDRDIRTARIVDGVYSDDELLRSLSHDGHQTAKDVAAYWADHPDLKGLSIYVADLGDVIAGPRERRVIDPG